MAQCIVCESEYVEGTVKYCTTCGWDLTPYPHIIGSRPKEFIQKDERKTIWARNLWKQHQVQKEKSNELDTQQQQQLSQLQSHLENCNQQRNQLQSAVEELNQGKKQSEAKIADLASQLEQVTSERDNYQQQSSELKTQLARFQKQQLQLQDQLRQSQESLSQTQEELADLKTQVRNNNIRSNAKDYFDCFEKK